MKKSELRTLIREEVKKLNESDSDASKMIKDIQKPIYVGDFTDIIGKFAKKRIFISAPDKLNIAEIYGENSDMQKILKGITSIFKISKEYGSIGQGLMGLRIDVSKLTLGEYIKRLTKIYQTL